MQEATVGEALEAAIDFLAIDSFNVAALSRGIGTQRMFRYKKALSSA
jgi:hypothetical protein